VPEKSRPVSIPLIESRVPKPEEFVVLSKPLLDAMIRIGELLKDCPAKWAVAGDVGELLFGVNVEPDHIAVLTSTEGVNHFRAELKSFEVEPPNIVERKLARSAEVDRNQLPVKIKSYAGRFNIDGQRLDVHGDLRIKLGEWEWGDPLDYEPEYVYVVGVKVPVVPLQLKTELYMGLGWMDRVRKINEANARRHHKIG
jgi:hypothetical protein